MRIMPHFSAEGLSNVYLIIDDDRNGIIVDPAAALYKILPDHDAVSVAEIIKNLTLDQPPAPDTHHVYIAFRQSADHPFIPARADRSVIDVQRHPIKSL